VHGIILCRQEYGSRRRLSSPSSFQHNIADCLDRRPTHQRCNFGRPHIYVAASQALHVFDRTAPLLMHESTSHPCTNKLSSAAAKIIVAVFGNIHVRLIAPLISAFFHGGIWTPCMVPIASMQPSPKQHLDRFSRFCTAHPCDQRTHMYRHTDNATCDICRNRPHPMHCMQAMRPKTLHNDRMAYAISSRRAYHTSTTRSNR